MLIAVTHSLSFAPLALRKMTSLTSMDPCQLYCYTRELFHNL